MTCPRERFHRNGVWCKGCEQIVENPYLKRAPTLKPKAKGVKEMTLPVTEVSLEVVTPLQRKVEEVVARPFRHFLGFDDEIPEGGGLMLVPRAAECLTERLVWNKFRRLEDEVWKTLAKIATREEAEQKEEARREQWESDHRFDHINKLNETAVWTLGASGAHACWNLSGKKRKLLPTLSNYDGDWGWNG